MLTSKLPSADGRSVLALSASTQVDPDMRTAVLLAPRLFRLDVVIHADTLRTTVRNLSTGKLEMQGQVVRSTAPTLLTDARAAAYHPSATTVEFTLGDARDRVEVSILLALLHFAERGCHRVSAQAILRQSPSD